MKDGVWRVFVIVLLTVCGLWGLQFLPSFNLWGHAAEPVRLLSSLTPAETDSSAALPLPPPYTTFSCPEGVVCIEEYATDSLYGMKHFYEALHQLKLHPERKVRIAFYGDSYIEGDILTDELRHLLQTEYGGAGQGYLPMRSDNNDNYRLAVRVTPKGWNEYKVVDSTCQIRYLGPAGLYCRANGNASTEVRSGIKGQTPWEEHYVFASSTGAPRWSCVTDSGSADVSYETTGSIACGKATGATHSVRWQVVSGSANSLYFGMSLEGKNGVVLDNFTMRGESGMRLRNYDSTRLADFQRLRSYDLVIFQYGLNVISHKTTDTRAYFREMNKVITKFKAAFPHTSFLVLSMPDRAVREQGNYVTMPTIAPFINAQRQMAATEGFGFWSIYDAMQQEGGIVKMATAKPRLANLDYTHVNREGGKHVANHLYKAIQTGYEHYLTTQTAK